MKPALNVLAAALWVAVIICIVVGPVPQGLPSALTGGAVTASICAAIRSRGLSDRELVALGIKAGRSMKHADIEL